MKINKFLTGNPLVTPHVVEGEEKWTINSAIGFQDTDGHSWWTTPEFVSDGASIPKPLRVLFGNPFRSDYVRPAALHDFYYKTWAPHPNDGNDARMAVDQMFHAALLADGVNRFKARLMYIGVRSGGWVPWNKHATGR